LKPTLVLSIPPPFFSFYLNFHNETKSAFSNARAILNDGIVLPIYFTIATVAAINPILKDKRQA
jgi:hypothetical protein